MASTSDDERLENAVEEEELSIHTDEDSDREERVSYISPNEVKKGSYVVMRQMFPCKIVEVNWSKPGKHGSAKVMIVGLDIFTSRKYEEIYTSSKKVKVPEVLKQELQLAEIDEEHLLLTTKDGKTKQMTMPADDEDLSERIRQLFNNSETVLVTVISAMGKEKILSAREKKAAANRR